jgi:poly-gamma-glutamate capsule biosynthesis protein CapA/YwtB (metallophosphatase superfamily)
MKKILLGLVVVVGLFGYLSYSWMNTQGWSISSKETIEPSATSTDALAEKIETIPLLFVGDIMLGRYVETLSAKSGDELYPFNEVKDYLKRYVTIANLEGPIPLIHKPTPINGMSFSFPPYTPRILKEGGITAVSLANNHMFDKGKSGYEDTKKILDASGMIYFGGYAPTEDDYFKTTLGDTEVLVYGITMIATGWDEAQALEVTRKLRNEHPDSYVVVFIHWGDEYKTQNIYQRAFAHSLIDAGVDAIIGSHPHVVQGVEIYKGKLIFYSLGNFIFDQYQQVSLEEGIMVRMDEKDNEYIFDIIPIHSSRSVPSIATSTKRDQILQNISKQSQGELKEQILRGAIKIVK